ncbi:type II toxin-antitoxin system VapC family toxin [bacterium]|nr:MAG: type II toxin-antitoxin system VapC family toxin [bacterium]
MTATGNLWRHAIGLILDSSVLIAAERRGDTVAQFLKRVLVAMGNEETALSAVGLVELAHGIHRANTPEIRSRREAFIRELLADVPVYPLRKGSRSWRAELTGSSRARVSRFRFRTCSLGRRRFT